jgi:glucosamine-6-phosphate isomerase
MKIIRVKNYKELSRKAANIISAQVILKPDSVLGLATGSTPEGTYAQLIEWYKKGDIDFSQVKTVNLDEYRGLTKDNPQSYNYFMRKHFFDHVNIKQENINLPDGMAIDPDVECFRYDNVIKEIGEFDLQLLGCGHNGHIGFNEPSNFFAKGTHLVDLSDSTIQANKRFFKTIDDVPRQAYSIGIQTIMLARRILIIISGKDKAQAVKNSFFGPVTPKVPASILQLHRDVVIIADEDALSLCKK